MIQVGDLLLHQNESFQVLSLWKIDRHGVIRRGLHPFEHVGIHPGIGASRCHDFVKQLGGNPP